MKYLTILLLFFLVTPQKRIINNRDFDYEFYITQDEVKHPKEGKLYYWYKSGQIHHSKSAIGGSVLHDSYTKYYKSSQLAEKGNFKLGLKDGVWRTWNEEGELQVVEEWKKGIKNGKFIQYDSVGKIVVKGQFQNHKQHGTWIDYAKKDTLYFKEGNKIVPKVKDKTKDGNEEKESFFKRLFKKKDKDPVKEQERKAKKEKEKKEREAKRAKRKEDKKAKENGVTKT